MTSLHPVLTTAKIAINLKWTIIDTMAIRLSNVDRWYQSNIGEEYEREATRFGVTKHDNILHVGCGKYPLSEIVLNTQIGSPITGIDNKKHVVNIAQRYINRTLQNHTITLEHGDGRHYTLDPYNVIILSSCTTPLFEVLDHVSKTAKSGTKLIIRELNLALPQLQRYLKDHPRFSIHETISNTKGTRFKALEWSTIHATIR